MRVDVAIRAGRRGERWEAKFGDSFRFSRARCMRVEVAIRAGRRGERDGSSLKNY